MSQDLKQSRAPTRCDYRFLTSEDKAAGFAIEADECDNITLLKQSKRVAWFSKAVSEELAKVFIRVIMGRHISAKRRVSGKRNPHSRIGDR